MMTAERISYLCRQYLDNTASAEELDELFPVLNDEKWKDIIDDYFYNCYYTTVPVKKINQASRERIFELILSAPRGKPVVKRLWASITVAASLALLVSAGIHLYRIQSKGPAPIAAVPAAGAEITHGSNRAVLTLANGKQIVLSDSTAGQLAIQGNAVISKSAQGELVYNTSPGKGQSENGFNTFTTPRGGQFHVILPDGSHVWLNDASSVHFRVSFAGTERRVNITGEAYFDIKRDAARPFIVEAGQQEIRVLGTQFNINSYADEQEIKTTLLQGKISVTNGKQQLVLLPGQQAVSSRNQPEAALTIQHNAGVEEVVAWKEGYFQFKKARLPYIMRQLSRWYDVDIIYQGNIKEEEFTGTIPRYVNLGDALEILRSLNVKFIISGRNIIVQS